MRLLLDEMYGERLARALRTEGVDAVTAVVARLAGRSDTEVFAWAQTSEFVVLTENVGDFARIAADHLSAGRHHRGLLLAVSTRFSRRPAGVPGLVGAVTAVGDEDLDDRTVYLRPAG